MTEIAVGLREVSHFSGRINMHPLPLRCSGLSTKLYVSWKDVSNYAK